MRAMSFALTTEQIIDRTKTVTRRIGWRNLQPGTRLEACRKVRGVKREDRELLAVIEVVSVRREPLLRMIEPCHQLGESIEKDSRI